MVFLLILVADLLIPGVPRNVYGFLASFTGGAADNPLAPMARIVSWVIAYVVIYAVPFLAVTLAVFAAIRRRR